MRPKAPAFGSPDSRWFDLQTFDFIDRQLITEKKPIRCQSVLLLVGIL